jgi:hypothetical protein
VAARIAVAAAILLVAVPVVAGEAAPGGDPGPARIRAIDPPDGGFYSKLLEFRGIPIKAHREVADEALLEAEKRLAMMLQELPAVRARLRAAGRSFQKSYFPLE